MGIASALTAVVAGIAASFRRTDPSEKLRAPRWFPSFFSVLCGLVVGMIVVAVMVSASPASGAANSTVNGMPAAHMAGQQFVTSVVLVAKGEKLMLVDDDNNEHVIQNGFWSADKVAQSQSEAGAPSVQGLDIKAGTIPIGPFNTAGIFHLYCTLHPGMNLTVVVQ